MDQAEVIARLKDLLNEVPPEPVPLAEYQARLKELEDPPEEPAAEVEVDPDPEPTLDGGAEVVPEVVVPIVEPEDPKEITVTVTLPDWRHEERKVAMKKVVIRDEETGRVTEMREVPVDADE